MIDSLVKLARNVRADYALRSPTETGAGHLPLWDGCAVVRWLLCRAVCLSWLSMFVGCCVRWAVLVVAVLLLVCACARVVAGWAWCRVVRLAQVIVAVAVRLCEALWRPFWVGVVSWCGAGV